MLTAEVRSSYLFLRSICGHVLFWLKYVKEIWPQTDNGVRKGGPHRKWSTLEESWGHSGVLRPHFESSLSTIKLSKTYLMVQMPSTSEQSNLGKSYD